MTDISTLTEVSANKKKINACKQTLKINDVEEFEVRQIHGNERSIIKKHTKKGGRVKSRKRK